VPQKNDCGKLPSVQKRTEYKKAEFFLAYFLAEPIISLTLEIQSFGRRLSVSFNFSAVKTL